MLTHELNLTMVITFAVFIKIMRKLIELLSIIYDIINKEEVLNLNLISYEAGNSINTLSSVIFLLKPFQKFI